MAYLGNNSLPFDPTRTTPAPRDADRFSGNGSTTAFTLSRSVSAAVDIEVFVENVQQEPIVAYDVNGTSLTFTGAPASGTNNVYVVYRNFQSGAQVTMPDGSVTYSKLANNIRIFTTDNLTPNGNNSVFTLSEPPADANTVFVTVDGVMQRAPVHYNTSGSTITFTSAPPAGSNVHVRHLGFRTTSTITQLAANSFISQPNIASPTITGTPYFTSNVGIGTNAPDAPLVVSSPISAGNGYAVGTVKLISTSTNSNPGILFNTNLEGSQFNSAVVRSAYPGSNTNTGGIVLEVTSSATMTEVFRINGDKVLKFDSGYGSVAAAYGCRAWVNFNGTGTVAIRGNGNVSSITDRGVGLYRVNFTTSMPDTNYCVTTASQPNGYSGANAGAGGPNAVSDDMNVAYVPLEVRDYTNAATDSNQIFVAVFR